MQKYILRSLSEALPLITKITGSAYKLHTNYNQLFLADNDKMGRKMNLSLPLLLMVSVAFGGTTFLTHTSWKYENI
jgi:hypothetical protein